MVGIHVVDDFSPSVGERIRFRAVVFRGSDPAHHAEATYVIHVHYFHPIEREVLEINPVFAVRVAFQIELSCCRHFGFLYGHHVSKQRDARCA